jgi:hypothetical protein
MLIVLWNPQRFYIVTMLHPRASFNASWFIDGNLAPLVEKFFPAGWLGGRRKLVVHIDSAPAHNSRMTHNSFEYNLPKKFPHPRYSSDICPSDFYLFGRLNGALIGREIPDEIDFLEAATALLNGILDAVLPRIFRSWIERVER